MNILVNCTSGGCGSKIGPAELSNYLSGLPANKNEKLLVGFDSSDDAAVYLTSADQAIVSTVDFFPPMVEDPYLFGKIAAANAMSDIYAMGGKVIFALNLVCFPQSEPMDDLGEILKGGAEKVLEAGAVLSGGHSIYDHEIKYGLSVTGTVHPDKILRNNTCREGDCLILTKPLGVGLILSAWRGGVETEKGYDAAVSSMQRLNKYAAQQMNSFPVNACTDVTGFGLLVHACEMAGTEKTLIIDADSLPLLPGALKYASEYLATAAGQRNRIYAEGKVDLSHIDAPMQEILFDPQTSGGLLISVPTDCAAELLSSIREKDGQAAIIGQVTSREKHSVIVL